MSAIAIRYDARSRARLRPARRIPAAAKAAPAPQVSDLDQLIEAHRLAMLAACDAWDARRTVAPAEADRAHGVAVMARDAARACLVALLARRPSSVDELAAVFGYLTGPDGEWSEDEPQAWEVRLLIGAIMGRRARR